MSTKPKRKPSGEPPAGPWVARWNLGGSRAGGFAGPEGWYIYNPETEYWSGIRCKVHQSKSGNPGPFYTQKQAEAHARFANKVHARSKT